MKTLLLSLVVILSWTAQSQDLREQFERSKNTQSKSFTKFQQANDSLFAKFIEDSWQKMKVEESLEPDKEPKPTNHPDFEGNELDQILYQGWPQDTAIILRSFNPDPLESPAYFPELGEKKVYFFGANLKIKYPIALSKTEVIGTGDSALIDYWLVAGKTGYQALLEDLFSYRDEYSLPDYAFYLLIHEFVKSLNLSEDKRVLLVWFLMNKASYACKIGYVSDQPTLLLGMKGKIYGKPYFKQGDLTFYAIEGARGDLYTYGNPKENKLKPLDLFVSESIDLPVQQKSQTFHFGFDGKSYDAEIFYNQNVTDLLGQFPNSDVRHYLNSVASRLTLKSLKKQFDPIFDKMTQIQKGRFLLAFVQSFPYQTDNQQFGVERIFYPDEFLAYRYSDCDDRVVFLNYLLRIFTDMDVIAVVFPQHVALALHLPPPIYGESVLHEGRKYTFCDPTYFNAPLGAVIPEADKSKARILRILR